MQGRANVRPPPPGHVAPPGAGAMRQLHPGVEHGGTQGASRRQQDRRLSLDDPPPPLPSPRSLTYPTTSCCRPCMTPPAAPRPSPKARSDAGQPVLDATPPLFVARLGSQPSCPTLVRTGRRRQLPASLPPVPTSWKSLTRALRIAPATLHGMLRHVEDGMFHTPAGVSVHLQ